MKITSARITPQPRPINEGGMFDPMPIVFVTTEDGNETKLFSYYPNEIVFTPEEFIGLTVEEARHLKFVKDREYLRS